MMINVTLPDGTMVTNTGMIILLKVLVCYCFRLNNLFNGFNDRSAQRLPVYMSMIKFAGFSDLMTHIPASLKQVGITINSL